MDVTREEIAGNPLLCRARTFIRCVLMSPVASGALLVLLKVLKRSVTLRSAVPWCACPFPSLRGISFYHAVGYVASPCQSATDRLSLKVLFWLS